MPKPQPRFTSMLSAQPLRQAIRTCTRSPEQSLLPQLVKQARMTAAEQQAVRVLAAPWIEGMRAAGAGARAHGAAASSGLLSQWQSGLVQGLMQEYALSSQEGVALMCLAEALLRIPDEATRDALIRDKIGGKAKAKAIAKGAEFGGGLGAGPDANPGMDWEAHLGRSPSLFVNAATWGLLLTGKLVSTHREAGLKAKLMGVVAKGGEPLIRKGVDMAMRLLGEQFVTGQTIQEALAKARPREARGFRFSYDMLGEAALTAADAQRYCAAYEAAIHAIGKAAVGADGQPLGPINGPGISIKLSALHPRYSRAQLGRVLRELYPRLLALAELAKHYNLGLNIDAEEHDRLDLSLELLEQLCQAPQLQGWQGLGFVVQAYQKRCPAVLRFIIDLAQRSGRRLMVRLVKGAYWDSEIKRAQVEGQAGYPVYTRKAYTDVAYLACARQLLAATEFVFPQFATHNAHTCAAIQVMAGPQFAAHQYEFQCLHGMGEPLYEQVMAAPGGQARPCRIYAPVGTHETLLAYLVRRLLENGANSSFVHRLADATVPVDALLQEPVDQVQQWAAVEGVLGAPHPALPLPRDLFTSGRSGGTSGGQRGNSLGLDLADEDTLAEVAAALANAPDPNLSPAQVPDASAMQVQAALAAACSAALTWAQVPASERARILEQAADALQTQMLAWLPLLVHEAGKTCANAVGEVREAVDFLRYYAAQVRQQFDNTTHLPLGPVLCISPWNFPLAIFMGQVAAALAAGNTVLAKPAEQTPRVAAAAVRLLHQAGVPTDALQLLPGPGETVGASLVADTRVQAVLFTGSTAVAKLIQTSLAKRLTEYGQVVPLIAETGGLNALVVDSSALPEQTVADVLYSAFDSAGQRCSALRLLCVQDDGADRLLSLLRAAMQELRVGDPSELATDVGPVIDAPAARAIRAHVQAMGLRGHPVWQVQTVAPWVAAAQSDRAAALDLSEDRFVPPTLIEIKQVADLQREVFGPVLHVLRYRREELPQLLAQISATGYGLTQGVHSRIDETVAQVQAACEAGNLYVNRNLVGAVVGVQPFGGEGLSGTGPKAGGPLYLLRLLRKRPSPHRLPLPVGHWQELPGSTGESNRYALLPRKRVLCLADDSPAGQEDLHIQLAAVLAAGARALCLPQAAPLVKAMPAAQRALVDVAAFHPLDLPPAQSSPVSQPVAFDSVLQHGTPAQLLATAEALAMFAGPVVSLWGLRPGESQVPMLALVRERALCVNTAASGGNASLMMLA